MILRDHYNEEELEAARVLDMRSAGFEVSDEITNWALFVLGDGVGLIQEAA